VLTETRVEGASWNAAVIGLGLNLRTPAGGFDLPGAAALDPVALDTLVPASRVPTRCALARATVDRLVPLVGRCMADRAPRPSCW